MGVCTNPGAIAFTVIPRDANSFADDSVMPITAALDAL
jgi:hypothetical protein